VKGEWKLLMDIRKKMELMKKNEEGLLTVPTDILCMVEFMHRRVVRLEGTSEEAGVACCKAFA
jgi:hypothetical protein